MRLNCLLVLMTMLVLGFGGSAASHAAPSLDKVDTDQLRKVVLPKPNESKWLAIPWETSIWKARQRAAKEGKPILLWEMDGHPMGCT